MNGKKEKLQIAFYSFLLHHEHMGSGLSTCKSTGRKLSSVKPKYTLPVGVYIYVHIFPRYVYFHYRLLVHIRTEIAVGKVIRFTSVS